LRELASRVREIAHNPIQEERKQLWRKLNGLERCRIPILLHVHYLFIDEVVPESALVTTSHMAREYERQLRLQVWQWENVDDDWVTEPVLEYETAIGEPQLLTPNKTQPETDYLGAYHVEPVLKVDSDPDEIVIDAECYVDWDATKRNQEWAEEVFDGILQPIRRGPHLQISPYDYVCEIRGMDKMCIDMAERPEWIEEVIRRVYRLHTDVAKQMEHEGALTCNNQYNPIGTYTDELPAPGFDPSHVRLKDIWGFSVAQASVCISPEMHERFVTQFDREYLSLFGLAAAACCEPVDKKMHLYRTIPNLRRISVSMWNDFAKAAEGIGTDYIYSFRPTAIPISQRTWNIEEDKKSLQKALEQSQGCRVDIYNCEITTCRGKPERLTEWARMAKRLAEQYSD
jgi:hypothetical protein